MKVSDKKLSVKSLIILTIVLPVIVILVSGIAVYLTAKNAGEQKTVDYSFLYPGNSVISTIPQNNKEAAEMSEKLLRDSSESGIMKYSSHTDVSITEISSDNKSLEGILSFASSSFNSHFSSLYSDTAIKYGENADAVCDILPGSIPSDYSAEIKDNTLEIKLIFNNVFKNMYFTDTDKKALNSFITDNKDVFTTLTKQLIPTQVVYTFTFTTDSSRITALEVLRNYDYTSTVAFNNTLVDLGSNALSMKLAFSERYNFSYAGIEIAQDVITLTKNGYESLSVTPFTEDGLSEDEYSLRFISSDENIITVDENGQVEAKEISATPQTVTVELKYLGKTFTDSCTVFVVNETESIKLSEDAVTLKAGEAHTLSAKVLPEKATIKDVRWISSDESVVCTDENGEITAKSKGTATITAVTVQGFLAAECTVTVTE